MIFLPWELFNETKQILTLSAGMLFNVQLSKHTWNPIGLCIAFCYNLWVLGVVNLTFDIWNYSGWQQTDIAEMYYSETAINVFSVRQLGINSDYKVANRNAMSGKFVPAWKWVPWVGYLKLRRSVNPFDWGEVWVSGMSPRLIHSWVC